MKDTVKLQLLKMGEDGIYRPIPGEAHVREGLFQTEHDPRTLIGVFQDLLGRHPALQRHLSLEVQRTQSHGTVMAVPFEALVNYDWKRMSVRSASQFTPEAKGTQLTFLRWELQELQRYYPGMNPRKYAVLSTYLG